MTDSIRTFIYYISGLVNHIPELNPIYELGSLPAPSQIEIANMRSFFPNKEYIGIDQYPGINVDQIANIERLQNVKTESVGLVLCLETIEHTEHPRDAISEIFRILKPDGMVVITTPMLAPVHMEEDYWRATPKCMEKIMLYGYKEKAVYYQGETSFPHNIVGVGSKSKMLIKIDLDYLNSLLVWPYPFPYKKL